MNSELYSPTTDPTRTKVGVVLPSRGVEQVGVALEEEEEVGETRATTATTITTGMVGVACQVGGMTPIRLDLEEEDMEVVVVVATSHSNREEVRITYRIAGNFQGV